MKNISSNRSFGLLFSLILFIIAFWNFRGEYQQIKILPLFFSLIFFILGLINSKLLNPFNVAWIKFGEILGKIIAPIIMGIVYFFVVTPIGLLMRLVGKDLLLRKFTTNDSYWIKRKQNITSMKRQF